MKSPIRFGRRDNTHADVVKGLRKCGYSVLPQDDYDMLVKNHAGQLFMLDAKSPGGKPTELQGKMLAAGWPIRFVTCVEDALAIIGSRDSVSELRREGL